MPMACAAAMLRWGLTAAFLCALPAEGKFESGTIRLDDQSEESKWAYVSKFGYGVGVSSYEVRFRLRNWDGELRPPIVDLDVYLDEDWDFSLTLPACNRAPDGKAKRTFSKVSLGENGEWGTWSKGRVTQNVRSHIWYFAASRCGGGSAGAAEIDFEIRMQQHDGSELGVEMRCMPFVSALLFVCLSAFLASFGCKCRQTLHNADALHPIILALGAAVALQWAALLLEVIHLGLYSRNGFGAPVADFLSGAMDMLSQVLSATLLVAIAHGYSLSGAAACSLSSFGPVSAGVAALHVLLVLLDKWGGDASYEHHENGGALGLVLLAARLALFGLFTKGVMELKLTAGLRLQSFLRRFQVAGSAYLLCYPMLFLVVQGFAPYLRHPLLQIGLLASQTCSAFWLASLFLSKGSFYEVSTLSDSLLPGLLGGGSCHGAGLAKGRAGDESSLRRRVGC